MQLTTFRTEISNLLPTQNYRPFVCQGSPLDCRIFIVGINPATDTGSFWDYWSDECGFQYQKWLTDYKQARQANQKRELSPTRRNLTIISDTLAQQGVKSLETNIYSKSTSRAKEILQQDKVTMLFDFLLRVIKPAALLLHGRETVAAIEGKIGQPLISASTIEVDGVRTKVMTTQHLSYQFSKDKALLMGQQLIQLLQ